MKKTKKQTDGDVIVILAVFSLKVEDLIGLPIEEQKKIIKKSFRRAAKKHHPDSPTGRETNFKRMHDTYEMLEKLVNDGYFLKKQEVKIKNESNNDIFDTNFVNNLNKTVERRKMEELLHEYEEEYEERKNRVSKMTEEFNKPDFSIKTAIQYCKNKIRTFIRKISSFHNQDEQER